MSREAVLRLTLTAGAALTAHGTPVEDDQVTGGYVGNVFTDSLHNTGGFMAEQVGEVLPDTAGDVVVISLADATGEDLNEGLALAGVGDVNGGDDDGCVLLEGHNGLDLVHAIPLLGGAAESQPLDKGLLIYSILKGGAYPVHRGAVP